MNFELNMILLPILVIAAITALSLKDLAAATIVFSAFSFLSCIVYTALGAVDVAFTEAVIGAAVSAVVFFTALYKTARHANE